MSEHAGQCGNCIQWHERGECPCEEPAPCPRCAALEAEVGRLEASVSFARGEGQTLGNRIVLLTAERDAKAALLAELAAAAKAWDETLSEYCDGPERDRVRDLLRRVEAEAGGGEG